MGTPGSTLRVFVALALSSLPATGAIILDPGTPTDTSVESLIVMIDENGVGTYKMIKNGVTTSGALTPGHMDANAGLMMPDFPAGTLVPSFTLPVMTAEGWVRLYDPDPLTGLVDKNNDPGDVLLFHGNSICFYSDRDPGETEPQGQYGDIGVPNRRNIINPLDLMERGGQAGFANYFGNAPFFQGDSLSAGLPNPNHDPNFATVQITIISDTPEPATIGMILPGLALLAYARSRWHKMSSGRTWNFNPPAGNLHV
jgi:hypothetical protein